MSNVALTKQARILMWLVTVPLAALVLVAVGVLANMVWFQSWRMENFARVYGFAAIYYLPMAFYIAALWMIRSALKQMAEGALFDAVLPRLLKRVGLALFGGAVLTVVGVPALTALLTGHPYIRQFEPSAVTLGAVGAALFLFAQLVERAAAIRTELNEFV